MIHILRQKISKARKIMVFKILKSITFKGSKIIRILKRLETKVSRRVVYEAFKVIKSHNNFGKLKDISDKINSTNKLFLRLNTIKRHHMQTYFDVIKEDIEIIKLKYMKIVVEKLRIKFIKVHFKRWTNFCVYK